MCSAFSTGASLCYSPMGPSLASQSAPESVAIIGPMSLEGLSDEELAVRYAEAVDAAAQDLLINELFRRNYARIARWCLRFVDNREAAADLSQEVFTKAYQNLKSFQAQSKFSTWLFSIARNHCLNSLRSNMRQASELKGEVGEDFFEEIPDGGYTPYDEVERESTARMVTQMLNDTLDETEKKVFTLHYGEDVPLDAITRILGLGNQSGAKAYIVSAKRKLARLVQKREARDRQNRI